MMYGFVIAYAAYKSQVRAVEAVINASIRLGRLDHTPWVRAFLELC